MQFTIKNTKGGFMNGIKEKILNFILAKILPTDEGIVLVANTRSILSKSDKFDLYGDTMYDLMGMINNLDRRTDLQLEDFMSTLRHNRLRYWFLFNKQFIIKDLDSAVHSLFKSYTKLNNHILELERKKTHKDERRLSMLRKIRRALWTILKEFLA